MKNLYAAGIVVFLTFGVIGAQDGKNAKDDAKKFAGSWTVDGLTYEGEEHKLKFKITFKDDIGIVKGNDEVEREYAKIRFKLDPAEKTKQIDITVVGGSQTDAKMQGIYEFRDSELRLCVRVFGNERPKEFAAPQSSSTVLLTLKRAAK